MITRAIFHLVFLHNDPPFVLLCGCHSGQLTVLPEAETHCNHPETVLFYFQSYALISMVINAVGNLPAEAYFSEQLQNLIKHDKTGPISYLDTLRVFLRNSMSYSQTAEELYIHRSTVVDRISRIERELDVNLKDPDTRLQLEIILKAMEIEDMVQQSRE